MVAIEEGAKEASLRGSAVRNLDALEGSAEEILALDGNSRRRAEMTTYSPLKRPHQPSTPP